MGCQIYSDFFLGQRLVQAYADRMDEELRAWLVEILDENIPPPDRPDDIDIAF
jgi:hypothetical protein